MRVRSAAVKGYNIYSRLGKFDVLLGQRQSISHTGLEGGDSPQRRNLPRGQMPSLQRISADQSLLYARLLISRGALSTCEVSQEPVSSVPKVRS